ncbi:MAG: inorganic phosphate transporter, partial [Planctomycetes bacterium]|nr:inorganic phosphate transporter [Planctomycetota bacterium]
IIAEFAGAVLVGSHVSGTVERGIVDPSGFEGQPMDLVCGMLAAMLASAVWVHIATLFGQPVSTSHSIVGGVCGFGIASGARIYWAKQGFILLGWILSPIAGGICAFFLFRYIAKRILGAEDPVAAARRQSPFLVFLVVATLALSLIYKGLKLQLPFHQALAASVGAGLVAAALAAGLIHRFAPAVGEAPIERELGYVESIFRYLQVLTACYVAFAHGANDVANAVGPMAAVAHVYEHRMIPENVSIPIWLLAIGGFGIVIGVVTYGRRVIETVGGKIMELTPSRGFAAQFATATTVLVCSKLGLPISTSHTIVGAVIGVAFARGIESTNPRVVRDIMVCWVVTVPVAGVLSAIIYLVLRPIFV